jgi:hypothetical protein
VRGDSDFAVLRLRRFETELVHLAGPGCPIRLRVHTVSRAQAEVQRLRRELGCWTSDRALEWRYRPVAARNELE